MGGVKKKDGRAWVAVALADGRRGYMPGDAKVFSMRRATLLQNDVTGYSQPSTSSPVKSRYPKSTTFYLGEKINQDGKAWVRILDSGGNESSIEGSTRVKMITEVTKAVGRKNMLRGGLWCIGSTVVTVGTLGDRLGRRNLLRRLGRLPSLEGYSPSRALPVPGCAGMTR